MNAVTKIKGITGVPGPNQKSMTAVPIPKNQALLVINPMTKNVNAHP